MAIERKIVSLSVPKTVTSGTYEDMFSQAWNTAVSGAGAGDWLTINIEKKESAIYKDSYILWLEKS